MKNIIYKELTLNINKFFYVLPLLLACLFFIPDWIYTLIPLYFFWISVSNIYGGYQAQRDQQFISVLPVTKREVVQGRICGFVVMELLHLGLASIFAIIHNALYGKDIFFLNPDYMYFGIMFVIFGIFNIIFLPGYFKTGYKFGKPVLIGIAVTLLSVGLVEYLVIAQSPVGLFFESSELYIQLLGLGVGFILFIGLTYVSYSLSYQRYKGIDL